MNYTCDKCGEKNCKEGVYMQYPDHKPPYVHEEVKQICTRCFAEKNGWFLVSKENPKKEPGTRLEDIKK